LGVVVSLAGDALLLDFDFPSLVGVFSLVFASDLLGFVSADVFFEVFC